MTSSCVAAEDKALLERLADKSISLDPAARGAHQGRRITLEMRRIMADLVAEAEKAGEP